MTLRFFIKMCNPEKTKLVICTLGKEYTEQNCCDFVFTYEKLFYKNPFWDGTYKVGGKPYKNAEIAYIEPFSNEAIKVVVK